MTRLICVSPQGRKNTVKQPHTSRRNSRRETSQTLRMSTATWLALLIQTTFNSCSTQSRMSLSPIISVAAVSIRINIPVAEPIGRHTLTFTHMNTTDMYCENGGARENERLRDCQLPRERSSDREGENGWKNGRERKRYTYVPPLLLPTTCGYLVDFLSDTLSCSFFQRFTLSN